MTNDAARKTAAVLNSSRGMGGQIVADRNTGECCWYSDDSYPGVGPDEVCIPVRAGKISRAMVLAIAAGDDE